MREKILVSACLIGTPCRFDGASKPCDAVMRLGERYDLLPVCPECLGGLPTPRIPCEQRGACVVNSVGEDMTDAYRRGADAVVAVADAEKPLFAIMKARSPACGHGAVYDGTFSRVLREGEGIATAALLAAGYEVYTEEDVAHLPLTDAE